MTDRLLTRLTDIYTRIYAEIKMWKIRRDLATARANWQEVTEIYTRMTDEARQELKALEEFCGVES